MVVVHVRPSANNLKQQRYDCHITAVLLLALAVLPHELEAALGGVPERPVPGRPWPTVWAALANDDLGGNPYATHDDWRTAAINAGVHIDRTLVFVDYSILTVRDERIRSDELTLSLGRVLLTHEEFPVHADITYDLSLGIGHRLIGDLGGSDVQNGWHELIDAGDRHYAYEDSDHESLVWLNTEWTWREHFGSSDWCWGTSATVRGLVTTEGAAKISPALHALVQRTDFDLWAGIRYESRGGDAPTHTKTIVRDMEDGSWFTYGVRPFRYVYFTGGLSMETEGMYGALGFIYPAPEDRSAFTR